MEQNNDFEIEENLKSKDMLDIFLDNSSDILTENFLSSKKKLMNATAGRNEIFEKLRLKGKALDMMQMIVSSNKDLSKSEDLFYAEDLKLVFLQSKNDKTMFENISKKVKSLLALIAKNQVQISKNENYKTLINVLIDVMNTHFEHPFLQQILDIVKTDDTLMNLLISELFNKFFKGRNVIIKNQDLRYLIKLTFNGKGPFYYITLLLSFSESKSNGGARTTHQIKQLFDLLNYILELSSNKCSVKDKHESNGKNKENGHNKNSNNVNDDVFKEKYLSGSENFQNILAIITKKIKGYISRLDEEETKSKDNKLIISSLINFYTRVISFVKKHTSFLSKTSEEGKSLKKSCVFLHNMFKNMIEKIPDLKSLSEKILNIEESLI